MSDLSLNLSSDDFAVEVRLLHDPQGVLLVETPEQIALKYAEMRDDAAIQFAGQPEAMRNEQMARLDAAEKQETELFTLLAEQRGHEFKEHTFIFRVPTIEDHEVAEVEANKTQPRQELVYRRALTARCHKKTDYPGFTSFSKLRTDVALHVMRDVVSRVNLKANVRDFLLTQAAASGAEAA